MKNFFTFSRTNLLCLVTLLLVCVNSLYSQKVQYTSSEFIRNATIQMDRGGTSPTFIKFQEGFQPTALTFLNEYKKSFPAFSSANNELRLVQTFEDNLGERHYRFDQYYKEIKVEGAQIILHEKNGLIRAANGQLIHGIELDVNPNLSENTALSNAIRDVNAKKYMWENKTNEDFLKREQKSSDATFYPKGQLILTSGREEMLKENFKLAYRFDIYAQEPVGRYFVDVDAKNGGIVNKIDRIHQSDIVGSGLSLYNGNVSFTADEVTAGSLYRLQEHTTRNAAIETYNMQNGTDYNLAVDFTSSTADGVWDQTGVNTHWGAEATYDYYFTDHGRNSFDNAGGTIFSYAHFYTNYNNAFWDGSRMTYGDGDGTTFTPLVCLDVVGHEITHGVTEYSANLVYQGESGALNESFSDIFGNQIEFMIEGEPGAGTGSWRCGEDMTPSGLGIRNMQNPNEFGDPDTYYGTYWANTSSGSPDNGGVHTNSGVQNFWFYLLCEGGSGTNDYGNSFNVTGIGLTDAATISYRNLTVYLTPSSNYYDARTASINSATDLFGAGSQQVQSVMDAWDAVGVYELVPPEGVLVWEGILGGQDYSGEFINNYLTNVGFTTHYTNIFPLSLIGYDAVFLSFGNWGNSYTPFDDLKASIVKSYIEAGGKVYLEGGDALGFNQSTNASLHNLFGLASVADGGTNVIDNLNGQFGSIAYPMFFTSSTQVGNEYIDQFNTSTGVISFIETDYGNVAVQNIGNYGQKTFCFSYALAELVDRDPPSTRNDLMSAIVDFLDIGTPTPPSDISVSAASFTFNVPEGSTASDILTISNIAPFGAMNLNWSILEQEATLVLDNGQSLPVSINTIKNVEEKSKRTSSRNKINNHPAQKSMINSNLLSASNASQNPIKKLLTWTDNNTSNLNANSVDLILDDGTREDAIGLTSGGQFIWMNRFTPNPAHFPLTLTEVQILFGSGVGVNVGDLVDIYIYEDTDGDANPGTGANYLGGLINAPVQAVDDITFSTYSITPILCNGPNDVIIAVVNRFTGTSKWPASLDQTTTAYRSWIGAYSVGNPPNPPTLPPDALWGVIDDFGFPGNWMIRGFGVLYNCPWLTESPSSGTIPAGSSQNVDISVNATGLTAGTYNCNLVISSNDPDQPQVTIPVTLNITSGTPDWITQTSGTSQTLRNLKAVNDNVVWVCGYNGVVLKTTNGGTDWIECTPTSVTANNYSIEAFDETTAWLTGTVTTGTDVSIWQTTDGGSSWILQYNNPTGYGDGLKFFNSNDGIYFGDPDPWPSEFWELLTTSNGGVNWDRVSSSNYPPADVLNGEWGSTNSIDIFGDIVWFTSYYSQPTTNPIHIYKSTNKGIDWTSFTIDYPSGPKSSRIAFSSELNGSVITAEGDVGFTSDGGETWSLSSLTGAHRGITNVPGSNRFITVGNSGICYQSSDFNPWTTLITGTNQTLLGIDATPNTAWAVGTGGVILKYIINLVPENHFVPVWTDNPYTPMNIYVTSAQLDGVDLGSGDEIGVFDGDNCVGFVELTEAIPSGGYVQIIASADDPTTPEVDGFISGHTISYRYWDSNYLREITHVIPTYSLGDGSFSPLGSAAVSLNGIFTITQDVELTTGWNIFSLTALPDDPNMLHPTGTPTAGVLYPLTSGGYLVKTQNEQGNSVEQLPVIGWINNIGDWLATEGYYIKVNAPSTLTVTGPPVSLPINIPLTNGWNILGYPLQNEQNALTVLDPLITANQLIKVQDEAGNAVEQLPIIGWINNIGNFRMDEGYYIKVNTNTSLDLNEPAAPFHMLAKANKTSNQKTGLLNKPQANHFQPVYTSVYLPMNIYVTSATLIGGGSLGAGDEIGIFDGSICVGAYVLNGPITTFISMIASTDDPTTQAVDGFTVGNTISYKFWLSSISTEISDYTANYSAGDGNFASLGTAVVSFTGILPVELTSFNANVNSNAVNLSWETATEVNNYGFEIERSQTSNVKGEMWKKIGFVQGNGNSNSPKSYSFVDNNLVGGSKFQYRLKQIDADGKYTYSDVVEVEVIPTEYALYQNYPNPFNPATIIRYSLPKASKVLLKVFDLIGNEIAALVNEEKEAGNFEVEFSGTNLTSGIYLIKLQAGDYSSVKKMMLLK